MRAGPGQALQDKGTDNFLQLTHPSLVAAATLISSSAATLVTAAALLVAAAAPATTRPAALVSPAAAAPSVVGGSGVTHRSGSSEGLDINPALLKKVWIGRYGQAGGRHVGVNL